MARAMPADRLERLVDCATDVFVRLGYRRTQMADVATALGVAKGTVYLAVESKEALFDLVVRYADAPRPLPSLPLPVRAPKRGATLRYVREELARNRVPVALARALSETRRPRPRAELLAIVAELYDLLAANRRRLKLADRAAPDWPELAALWFETARGGLVELLAGYVTDGIRRRRLRPVPDPAVAARLIVETAMFWAVHRHWDPHPQAVDEPTARGTVLQLVVDALVKE